MNRVFRFLIFIGMALFGRVAFRWFVTGSPTAGAIGNGGGASNGGFAQTQVAPLLEKVLGQHITSAEAGLVVGGTVIYAIAVGLVARILLGDRVFGARLNGVVALLGAWAAVGLYAAFVEQGSPDQLQWVIGLTLAGSILALAASAVVKAFVMGEFDAFMTGGPTRIGSAMRGLNLSSARGVATGAIAGARGPSAERLRAAAPPRGPSAERLRAAVSRSNPSAA